MSLEPVREVASWALVTVMSAAANPVTGSVKLNVIGMGDCLSFSGSKLMDKTIVDELRDKRAHALRHGRIITDRELLEGARMAKSARTEDGQAGDDQVAEVDNSDESDVKWASLPESLKVLPAPGAREAE